MVRRLVLIGFGLSMVVAVTSSAQPQNTLDTLPRRGWFGVALAPHESGAVVTSVADGSTAAAEGIRAGDVIRAVDDKPIRTPNDVIAFVSRHAGGETAAIDLIREGQSQRRSVVLRSFPRETLTGHTFEYGSVTLTDGSRLRTILSMPDRRERPLPAVMLIQGGGCGTVDLPFAADVGQSGLLRTIAAQGYVTMRVDKSGLGDSQGQPCDAIGYTQELDGYRAALAVLRRHPAVDARQIHLLGISLGGVFAPVLAREGPIQSIVVYGTLATAPSSYPGRSERFFQEFAAVDVPAAWSAVESRVLVLRGQFDEGAREADHAQIASIVNAHHPGRATHRELAGLDHCWSRHETMDKSRGHCGAGQTVPTLSDAVLAFLGDAAGAQRPLAFDVVSVKEREDPGRPGYDVSGLQGGRFVVTALPAPNLLQLAYPEIVDRERIIGGPTWIDNVWFDIEARFDPMVLRLPTRSTPADSPIPIPSPVSEMMRSLLADRFKLTIHFDERDISIFALVVARREGLGPNIRRSDVNCSQEAVDSPKCETRLGRDGKVVARAATISDLVGILGMRREADRPIRDLTGLDGRFDFTFELTPRQGSEAESIFSMLPRQFGLSLEPRRIAERVIVIDHVERPSPN